MSVTPFLPYLNATPVDTNSGVSVGTPPSPYDGLGTCAIYTVPADGLWGVSACVSFQSTGSASPTQPAIQIIHAGFPAKAVAEAVAEPIATTSNDDVLSLEITTTLSLSAGDLLFLYALDLLAESGVWQQNFNPTTDNIADSFLTGWLIGTLPP